MGFQAVKDLLVGVLMGAVSFLPGASGSTIAVIFRVYERLVADVADIKNKLLKDLKFIIPIGVGVLLGMLVCARGLEFLLNDYEIPMMFLFVGLIVTQIPDIKSMGDDGQKMTVLNAVAFIAGVAVMMAFMVIGWNAPIDNENPGFIIMVLVGVIYAMSLLSPGISGSTVLLALGFFTAFDTAISHPFHNLDLILPIALGLLVGALAFAKVIDYFMRNHRKSTYSAILGLTVGSALAVLINALRDLSGDEMIIQSVICLIIGAILGLGLNRLAHMYSEKKEE